MKKCRHESNKTLIPFLCPLVLLLAVPARSQVFTQIADSNTPVPGQPGDTFNIFSSDDLDPPMVSDSCIAFAAESNAGTQGIYLVKDGVIEVVADTSTAVPAGEVGEQFEEFEEAFAIDGCDVVFDGIGTGTGTGDTLGIYLKREGLPLDVVADNATPAPAGTFDNFEDPWLEDDVVVFWATTTGGGCDNGAIYRTTGGGFEVIADSCGGTPVPGGLPGETFADLETRPILEDGTLTFWGMGDQGTIGIYAQVDGQLLVVADTSTPIPGGGGAVFSQFLDIAPTSGGDTVFLGAGPEPMPPFTFVGLYRASAIGITIVIDLLDPPPLPGWEPGDSISFDEDDFLGFWFCKDLVTLGAVGSVSPATIFLIEGGEISALIAGGDTLGGMTVAGLSRFAHCAGDRIVFVAWFEDGSSAVYLATRVLFEDGFESGDTSAWSSTVP